MGKTCLVFRATEPNMVEIGKINVGIIIGRGDNVSVSK